MSLVTAWKAATAHCPFCSGLGTFDGLGESTCAHCKGSGDLMASLLEDAYRKGREDALVKMREVYSVTVLAGRQVSEAPIPDDLKRRLGL